jgi:hypothetical protein
VGKPAFGTKKFNIQDSRLAALAILNFEFSTKPVILLPTLKNFSTDWGYSCLAKRIINLYLPSFNLNQSFYEAFV